MNLKLPNVRLSYPALFEAKAGPEGGEPKYNAAFLIDKDNGEPEVLAMRSAILAVAKTQWGENNVKWVDGKLMLKKPDGKAALVKTCLRDGDEKAGTAGYENVMFFSASNKMPVPVVDKNPAMILTKASGKPYAGCYVNVSIRLWAQDNQFGKRVNAQLNAVQFAAEGEAFGDAPVNAEEVFSNIESSAPAGHAPSDNDGFDPDADPNF